MYHFFVSREQIGADSVIITGSDVNHMKNVLRMHPGEEILVSSGSGEDYRCRIERLTSQAVEAAILFKEEDTTELPGRLVLYQGLPKSDKMEWIIQTGSIQDCPCGNQKNGSEAGCQKGGVQAAPLAGGI